MNSKLILLIAEKLVISIKKSRGNGRGRRPFNNRNIECWRCFQFGHTKSDFKSIAGSNKSCQRCGSTGHLTKDCEVPNKQLRDKFASSSNITNAKEINHVQVDSLVYLDGKINDKHLLWCIDSASTCTLVSKDFIKSHKLRHY